MTLDEEDPLALLEQLARDHVPEDLPTDDAAQTASNDAAVDATRLPPLPAGTPKPVSSKPAQPLDLSGPLGYRPPSELPALQADAKKRRSEASVGQAVADFTERPTNFLDYAQRLGGGGVSAPPAKTTFAKDHAAEGDRAIADYGQRKTDAAAKDLDDPNGETAQIYRSALLQFAPELAEQLKGATPKQMERIQPWLATHARENNDLIRSKAAAEAKAAQQKKTDEEKAAALRLAQTNRAEDVADRRANTKATQDLAAAGFGLRRDEVKTKAEGDINDDVQKLGKELPGDVADFGAKYERIKARIAKNPGDIPGVGPIDSMTPAVLSGQDALEMQKDAGQMLAAYQKLITGAGASDAERANLAKISLDLGSEKGFAAGLESLKQAYDAKVRDVRARFRPEVVQRLEAGQKREGAVAPITQAQSSPRKVFRDRKTGELVEVE